MVILSAINTNLFIHKILTLTTMSIQIYSVIWPYMIKFYPLKMLWIFLFVIVIISTFLLIMYNARKEDLKKTVLPKDSTEKIHGKINNLKDDLKSNETKLNGSNKKTLNTTYTVNKKSPLRNLQKNLINDLKRDVNRTEEELAQLENEITMLSRRRENIKHEISKQQEEFNKCMQIFLTD